MIVRQEDIEAAKAAVQEEKNKTRAVAVRVGTLSDCLSRLSTLRVNCLLRVVMILPTSLHHSRADFMLSLLSPRTSASADCKRQHPSLGLSQGKLGIASGPPAVTSTQSTGADRVLHPQF